MASYKERKSEPLEIMPLDGYTVDYCDPQTGKLFYARIPSSYILEITESSGI